jgi:hypothetical protein
VFGRTKKNKKKIKTERMWRGENIKIIKMMDF